MRYWCELDGFEKLAFFYGGALVGVGVGQILGVVSWLI